MEVQIAA